MLWYDSEEEAKRKIYNVSCERYFGFGCEIDEETSNKLEGLLFLDFVYIWMYGFDYIADGYTTLICLYRSSLIRWVKAGL